MASNDKGLVSKIFLLGGICVIFIVLVFVINYYAQISNIQTQLNDQIQATNSEIKQQKLDLYSDFSFLADKLVWLDDIKSEITVFADHHKYFNSIFVIRYNEYFATENSRDAFIKNLNIPNFTEQFDRNGFFLSKPTIINNKKEFFLIKQIAEGFYAIGFFDVKFLQDFKKPNLIFTDLNGQYIDGYGSIYDSYDVDFYNHQTTQFLSNKTGGYDFLVTDLNDDFNIEICAVAQLQNLLTRFLAIPLLALVALALVGYLVKNLIALVNEIYEKPMHTLKTIIEGKTNIDKSVFKRNPEAEQIAGNLLVYQTELKANKQNFINANEKFNQIFQNNTASYIYANPINGNILLANNYTSEIFGSNATNLNIFDLQKDKFLEKLYSGFLFQNRGADYTVASYSARNDVISVRQVSDIIGEGQNEAIFYLLLDITKYQEFYNTTKKERESVSDGPYVMMNYDLTRNKVINITRNVEELWGYKEKQITDGNFEFFNLISDSDLTHVRQELNNAIEMYRTNPNDNSFVQNYRIRHRDKFFHDYSVFVRLVSETEAVFYFYLIDDTVKQKNMLDKEIKRHENIINAASFATWEWNINDEQISFNENFPKMRGYSDAYYERDITVKRFGELIHPNDIGNFNTQVRNYINGVAEKLNAEFRVRSKTGHVWVHMQGAVLEKNPNGTAKFLCGIIEDVSQRREAEYQMRLNASVFAYSNEGIVIMNDQFIVRDINKGFEIMTNYSKKDIVGKSYEILNNDETNKKIREAVGKDGFFRGEVYAKRKDGSEFPQILTINSIQDPDNERTHYMAIFFEITELKERENELKQIAHFDFLTKLPNRVAFTKKIQNSIAVARKSGKILAILYLDFDGFKAINDTYGHDAGDDFLRAVSNALNKEIKDYGFLARLGGDEFGAVVDKMKDRDEIIGLVNRLLRAGSVKFDIAKRKIGASVSIGVSFYNGEDYEEALKQADDAMYIAKTSGKNRYHVYAQQEKIAIDDEKIRFEKSLKNGEFFMLYQPIFNISAHRLEGFEMLLRWMHPKEGVLTPREILPKIKELGVNEIFNVFIIEEAIKFSRHFTSKFGFEPRLNLNFSVEDICDKGFYMQFDRIVQENIFNTANLGFEITNLNSRNVALFKESAEMYEKFEIGFLLNRTTLEDLELIKDLPFKALKTDVQMTLGINEELKNMKYIAMILNHCKKNNIACIAQGVEYWSALRLLKSFGFDYAQGNIISSALLVDEIEEFCTKKLPNIKKLDKREFEFYKLALAHNKFVLNFVDLIKNDEVKKFDINTYEAMYSGLVAKFKTLNDAKKLARHTEIYKQILGILSSGFEDKFKTIADLKKSSNDLIEDV